MANKRLSSIYKKAIDNWSKYGQPVESETSDVNLNDYSEDVNTGDNSLNDYVKNNRDKEIAAGLPMDPAVEGISRMISDGLSFAEAKQLESALRNAATAEKIQLDKRAEAEAAVKKGSNKDPVDLSAFEGETIQVPANDQRKVLQGGNANWRVDWDVAEKARQEAGFESQDVRKKASKQVTDNIKNRPQERVTDPRKEAAREGSDRYGMHLNEGDPREPGERYDDMYKAKDIEQQMFANDVGFANEAISILDTMENIDSKATAAFRKKLLSDAQNKTANLKVSDEKDLVSSYMVNDLRSDSQNERAWKLREKNHVTTPGNASVVKSEFYGEDPDPNKKRRNRVEQLANYIGSTNDDEHILETYKRIFGVEAAKQIKPKMKSINGRKEILMYIAHAILVMALSMNPVKSNENIG